MLKRSARFMVRTTVAFAPWATCLLGQALPTRIERSTLSVGAEFSDNSNHLLLGIAQNRRLAGLDVTNSILLRQGRQVRWEYEIELRPAVFLQDPTSTTTDTVQFGAQPPYPPIVVQDGAIQTRCMSSVATNPHGLQPGVTVVERRTCGTRWTYGAGLSPLGQRFTFLSGRSVAPYLLANAGLLYFTRPVPSDRSSSFNFAFAFGGGLSFHLSHERSYSVDYRVHHISNAGSGTENPGIDQQVVRVSYGFGGSRLLPGR